MGSNLVNPKTAINVVKAINLSKKLLVPKASQNQEPGEPELVEISPPKSSGANDSVNVRIISHELRKGMVSRRFELKLFEKTTLIFCVIRKPKHDFLLFSRIFK